MIVAYFSIDASSYHREAIVCILSIPVAPYNNVTVVSGIRLGIKPLTLDRK